MIDIFDNFLVYKPYGVISQFSPHEKYQSLDSIYNFPKNVYPIGRLDAESEGLLILSNNPQLNHRLLQPKNAHRRSYWVQLDGSITNEAIQQLQEGVRINVKGEKILTQESQAEIIDEPLIPFAGPKIEKENCSWINLTLTEGKYHQVRKMTAKVGFPTLRLIRNAIEDISILDLENEIVKVIESKQLHQRLRLN